MFDSVLVANRGEIARRVIRTLRALGVRSVAVYSEADAGALHVREADEAVLLGPAPPAQSYLDPARVLAAAQSSGAQAVHPGYGFLSESADFARAVQAVGLTWIGPPPTAMDAMSDKAAARQTAADYGVPVAPGALLPPGAGDDEVGRLAAEVGFPLLVKAVAGGGGIGMGVAREGAELAAAVATARSRAERFFGSPALLLERYLSPARHVEVQVLGLADGQVLALGERDCSVQRRYQKLAEETPAPGLPPEVRAGVAASAIRVAQAVGYRGAGTVEFLVSTGEVAGLTGGHVFLEMNTRLQVEHPITELVTGLDLVAEQLRVAAGEPPGFTPGMVSARGHAVEVRIYAEDPVRFLPRPGVIRAWEEPTGEGVRVDSGYTAGDTVTPYYDPLLAKLCAWGEDREQALERLGRALEAFVIEGPGVNLEFFTALLADSGYRSGAYDTGIAARLVAQVVAGRGSAGGSR